MFQFVFKCLKGKSSSPPPPTTQSFSTVKNHTEQTQTTEMKLVWSPELASKAYIDTVKLKSGEKLKESGTAELLAAMAAGWDAKLIVEAWSHGEPIGTSIGLAVAARHTCGRHVCVVPEERSRLEYSKSMMGYGVVEMEVVVGEAEEVMVALKGVHFVVVDCKRRDFARILRFARLSHDGAVLACKNALQRSITFSGFRWLGVLEKGTRVVRSVLMPVGQGLAVAYVGSKSGTGGSKKDPSRWIKLTDQESGEEHIFRR
ncbi:hypothetical protein HS088_TW17G00485 [Tripterygium wilfordii]|uniref:DUF1442 family protein n=1 Tax=Tripterygium wilfordii TaxID=458696 RepID=A0A7J7CFV9_TRIWF|nr:uncharacterized protein LOC119982929 [Tripterygium wilfordii]KAF5732952.1 hypothetical protein HS088_TW17G00485 [Tripterygium wilfordii]